MTDIQWSTDQSHAYLAAMKAVALAGDDHALDEIELDMLRATAEHVLHCHVDVDELSPIDPADLAKRITDQDQRFQAVEFLVLMPYLDGTLDDGEVELVDRFAAALKVTPPAVTSLHQIREGRLRRAQFDFFRRSLNSNAFPGDGVTGKLRVAFESFRQYRGDPEVAERYYQYETFPEGSLGKVFFDFYRARKFPMPGEKGSFSEFAVPHDLSHILGGFNTDMSGEIDVAGMEAGMSNSLVGYDLLLAVILDFHMGLKFSTVGILDPGIGNFHPDCFAAGFELGQGMNVDLMSDWDWQAVMGEQLSDVRAKYQIKGVSSVDLPAPQ